MLLLSSSVMLIPLAPQLLDKLASSLPGDCCKLQPSPLMYRNGQGQSFLPLLGWLLFWPAAVLSLQDAGQSSCRGCL